MGRSPLALDIVATDGGIEHWLAIPRSKAEALTAQLQTALPGIRLEVLEKDVLPNTAQAVELRSTSRIFPLAADRADAGAAALLASLQPLGAGELVHVQWIVSAAPVPVVPRRGDSASVLSGQRVDDGEDLRGLRRKQDEPLLHVVGRIGVSAPSGARRAHLLGRIRAALSVMDAPGMRLTASWLPSGLVVERLQRRFLPLFGWGAAINGREAAGLLGVPLGDLALPGLDVGAARQLPVSPRTLDQGVLLGVSDHPGTLGRELRLGTDDRLRHLHLIGPTGAGKSTLMAQMVPRRPRRRAGVVVVDPKRDLVETILDRLLGQRAKDVVVLDPVDTARPVGLNVLAREGDFEAERELVAENLLGVFQNLWKDSWGPRSDDILRASLLTLCSARAAEGLGAKVVEEYLDRGESARSADRPALLAMLERIKDRDIDFVIVHKVDRLARNRADDIEIALAIRASGARLVSASENIDQTPSGTLLHGIMATIAEFYSQNLAAEVRKGLLQKVRLGGTPTRAPLGYLNVIERVDGRDIRTVALDPERAPHVEWLFEAYATGDLLIRELTGALAQRGLTTRPTPKRPNGTPVTTSMVERMLANPYYAGTIVFEGVEYAGRHEPLISKELFAEVQALKASRRLSKVTPSRRPHDLTGSLFCGRCGDRLSLMRVKNRRGSTYSYFYCLGRQKHRTHCDQP